MDKLTKTVEICEEKDIRLRTKGVFRPVTKQIGNAIADIKDFFQKRSQDTYGVTVVPSECPRHLNRVKKALLHHLQPGSFLFQKNLVTGTEAASPLLVLMDSLALAMDLEVVARPSEVICDVLLAVCNQPVFVLTLVDGNPNTCDLKNYNNSVAREATGKLKMFMDERVCVVSGVFCMENIETSDKFHEAMKEHAGVSTFFIPLKTFETPLSKFNNIVMAFWASAAETKAVISCDTNKQEVHKRFLTRDQCVILVENINKREVKVQHKPGSGATTLMIEVARRLSRLSKDTLLVCSNQEEKKRLSMFYSKILTSEELKESDIQATENIVVEKLTWTFQVKNQRRCWKFVLLNEEEPVPIDQIEVFDVHHEENFLKMTGERKPKEFTKPLADDSLPLTDGMIARSAADSVVCRLKRGDNCTVVLGRAMIFNEEKVHRALKVKESGRVLTNMEKNEDVERPGQFSKFCGTCSSPVPVPPSLSRLPTPPFYWETSSTLTGGRRSVFPLLLEMGVFQGMKNMDEGHCVSALPRSVCVSLVDFCHRHSDCLCFRVWRKDQEDKERHQVGKCVSLSLPIPGVEYTFTLGLVLDVVRGRVGFIDVKREELLCKVDLKFNYRVFPMFYVSPDNRLFATRMRLVSGREICVSERKIQLIQQSLSD